MSLSQYAANTKRRAPSKGGSFSGWRDEVRPVVGVNYPVVMLNQQIAVNDPREQIMKDGKPTVFRTYADGLQHAGMTPRGFRADWCSAGNDPANPKPCVGCWLALANSKAFKTRDVYLFPLIHLAPYYRHPQVDDKGAIKKRDDGTPYFSTSLELPEVDGRTVQFPKDSVTQVFGRRGYLQLSPKFFKTFAEWDEMVQRNCMTHRNPMNLVALGCSNEECGKDILEVTDVDEQFGSEADMLTAIKTAGTCPHCSSTVFPVPYYDCQLCQAEDVDPVCGEIYDFVLSIQKQGEKTDTHYVLSNYNTLDQYDMILKTDKVNKKLIGTRTLTEIIEELKGDINFEDVMKPRSLEDQAKYFGLEAVPPELIPEVKNPITGEAVKRAPQSSFFKK